MKIYLVLIILLLSSCADTQTVDACLTGHTYGFFAGLWHGFIMFFSLIGSIFNDNIDIYAVNNNGAFYKIGYFIGVLVWFSGSTSKKKSK